MSPDSPAMSLPSERAHAEVSCTHCSLSVPAGLVKPGSEHQFCCHGCETAYSIIHSCGLDRYYALRQTTDDARPVPARGSGRTYADFDDPGFHRLYVKGAPNGACVTDLFLRGVHCSACVWLVERLPRLLPGVIEARLDLRRAVVRVTWSPAAVPLSRVAATLDAIGYAPHPAQDGRTRVLRRAEDRRMLVRIAVAGACAGNTMLFAFALYAGLFDTMEAGHREFFRWGSMVVTLVCLLWPGSVFFRSALGALRARALHLDVPIALALFAGLAWSVISTLRGHGEIYFDSLSVLVFALLVGRFIQHRQQRWASDAVELLFSLTPSVARLVDGQGIREVPSESLAAHDIVEVRAGDCFPADGEVLVGESHADQSILTGESRPVRIQPGSSVCAGTTNTAAPVRVRVTASGTDTRAGKLMRMVEDCATRKAPIVLLADRASGWFVAGMLVLSVGTFVAWLLIRPGEAVDHAVSLLIVTCPCALGLATPLALTVALGRAAREGLLIKGGETVQRLASAGVVYLDKTGTLTQGRLSLVGWAGNQSARSLVAALEAHSSHPLARALTRDLGEVGVDLRVEGVEQIVGAGISGKVDGREVIVGSPENVFGRCGERDSELASLAVAKAAEGLTPVAIAVDGRVCALAWLGDPLRTEAADLIQKLRARGWEPRILSGDHPGTVAAIAGQLGIADALGGQSPEDKLAAVRANARRGSVTVMVGDGVNDAAALAAADVGIAVHGGAEASLHAADVYISRPGLAPILSLLEGCERSMSVVKRNLGASLLYNITAAVMACTGHINPIAAAVIMPVSSLTVLFLSFKSRSFGSRT